MSLTKAPSQRARDFLGAAAVTMSMLASPLSSQSSKTAKLYVDPAVRVALTGDSAIRPFQCHVPQKDIADLRRRLAATRWPESETVPDRSQGVQLATMKSLVSYWQTGYDWRKVEAKLNALPQFITTID